MKEGVKEEVKRGVKNFFRRRGRHCEGGVEGVKEGEEGVKQVVKPHLVLPWVLAVQVDAVQDVLDQGVEHDGEQDRVLEPEHQLHRGALGGRGGGHYGPI